MKLTNIVDGYEISSGLRDLDIYDFNTREIIGTMPDLGYDQIDLALDSARKEYHTWRGLSLQERLGVFSKAGDMLLADSSLDPYVAQAGLCSQKVVKEDREAVARWLQASYTYMSHYLKRNVRQEDITGVGSIGVLIQSSMYQTSGYAIIDPLRAGNSIVVKLDSREPFSLWQIAQALRLAGAPVQIISGDTKNRPNIGAKILQGTDRVVFMGSPNSMEDIIRSGVKIELDSSERFPDTEQIKFEKLLQKMIFYFGHGGIAYIHSSADLNKSVRDIIYGMRSHYRSCKRTTLCMIDNSVSATTETQFMKQLEQLSLGETTDSHADIISVNGKLRSNQIIPYLEEGERFGRIIYGDSESKPILIKLSIDHMRINPLVAGKYLSRECPFAVLNIIEGGPNILSEVLSWVVPYLPRKKFLEASIFSEFPVEQRRHLMRIPSFATHYNQPTTLGLGMPERGCFREHEGRVLFLDTLMGRQIPQE